LPGGCKRRSKPLPSKPTTGADDGALNAVLRQTLRPDRIIRHWDDINRLAASFQDGLVRPSLVIATLQALQRHNPLQQAIQELGCLAKTRHILSYIDDSQLRRRILVGLNKQERLHGLARARFFGRQGRFTDRSYEAQLSRASALSLVVNANIVWNTEYLAAAAEDLAQQGCPVPESLWPHVTPLHWEHINLVGQYSFDEPLITGHLRPLRRKTAADEISA
jgi:TnpA family transposase